MAADTAGSAQSSLKVDDQLTRVTEWTLAPGTATGWHRHEYPYVIVPTSGGKLRIATADGDISGEMVVGAPYARPAGVEHDVINDGPDTVVFVEVEIKMT